MQTCASLDVRSLCTPGIEQVLLAWLNAEQQVGRGAVTTNWCQSGQEEALGQSTSASHPEEAAHVCGQLRGGAAVRYPWHHTGFVQQ